MKLKLNSKGQEVVDKRPVAIPANCKKPESLADKVRRLVKHEASVLAESRGGETFEEADDFDVGDDFDPTTPYEMDFDQEEAKLDPINNNEEKLQDDEQRESGSLKQDSGRHDKGIRGKDSDKERPDGGNK